MLDDMDIFTVLQTVGYQAMDRLVGTSPIDNLPCPVIEHKQQGKGYGPCRVMPPKKGDPGTLICHNCGEAWGTVKLAKELGLTEEAMAGKERYIPPREKKKKGFEKKPVEPFDPQRVWIESLAASPGSRALYDYFNRRWRSDEMAEFAVKHVGWLSRIKTPFFARTRQHLLMAPLYDELGVVVSGVKRFTGFGEQTLKSIRFPNEAVGLASGTCVWLGDPPPKAASYAAGSTLFVAEGEIDTVLLMALREAGLIEGGILGVPGSAANSKEWWERTREILKEPPNSVVLVLDADQAGDKYWQKSAGEFPLARRVSLPDGFDLTDVVNKHGVREAVSALNQAKRAHFKFYQLDTGDCAYLAGETWFVTKGKTPLLARLRASGYSDDEAKALYTVLPPARDLVFDPRSTEPVILDNCNTYLNQFRGLGMERRSGDCQLYKELLYWLCDQHEASLEHALDWLAKPLQHLACGKGAHRNKTALVFYGGQGSGKGLMFGPDGVMKSIYGPMMAEISQAQLEDRFDPRSLSSVLFLTANEVACSGYRDQKTLNRLKAWITEPTIQVRRMHRSAEEARIWFNIVFMSNDDMPIRLEPSDRRYSVFQQSARLPPNLTADLIKQRNAGWPKAAHLLDDLLDRKIDKDLTIPFTNVARTTLMESSKPSQTIFAELVAEFGISSVAKDWVDEMERRGRFGDYINQATGFIATETLVEIYKFWCSQVGFRHPVRAPQVITAVDKTIKDARAGVRGYVGNKRFRGMSGIPVGDPEASAKAQETLLN